MIPVYARSICKRCLSSLRSYATLQKVEDHAALDKEADFDDLPKKDGDNQHLSIEKDLHDSLRSVLWKFKAPIRFAFAYGSGVFPQKGYSKNAKPQVDYIFGVTYAQHFHSLNLNDHWDHYSFLRRFGSGVISRVQSDIGARVYFNPYVEVNGVIIKYGVVLIDDLCEDLLDWRTLYLAGRMHKPVKILRDHPSVRQANQRNLYSAVRTALLLLPERFDEKDLYTTISKISYMGDPRMSFGENPRKVENIVNAQLGHFRQLYAPFIEKLPNVSFTSDIELDDPTSVSSLAQDLDPVKRGNMVRRLPKRLRAGLYYQYRRKFGEQASLGDTEKTDGDESPYGTAFDQQIAAHDELPEELAKSIKAIVSWPSTSQSIKGILTAGPIKSWRYSIEKLQKARVKAKDK